MQIQSAVNPAKSRIQKSKHKTVVGAVVACSLYIIYLHKYFIYSHVGKSVHAPKLVLFRNIAAACVVLLNPSAGAGVRKEK